MALGLKVLLSIAIALIGLMFLYAITLWPVLFARYRAEDGFEGAKWLLISGYVFEVLWLFFLAWGVFHMFYRKKLDAVTSRVRSQARKQEIVAYPLVDEPTLVEVFQGIADADWDEVDWSYRGQLAEYRSTHRGGPRVPKPVKQGQIFLTQNALNFSGEGTIRKWPWDRILDVRTDGEALMVQVSGRQAISGVVLPELQLDELLQILEVMGSDDRIIAAEEQLQRLRTMRTVTSLEQGDEEDLGLTGVWLRYSQWLNALKSNDPTIAKWTAVIGLPLFVIAATAGARLGGETYASEFYRESTLTKFGEYADYEESLSKLESTQDGNLATPEVETLYSNLAAVDLSGKYNGKVEVVIDEATDPQGQGVPSDVEWPTPNREIVISQACSESLLDLDTCQISHGSYSLFRLDNPSGNDESASDYQGASLVWALENTDVEYDEKGRISSLALETSTATEDNCYSVDSGELLGVVISDIDATLIFTKPEYVKGTIVFRSVELAYSDDAGDPVEGEGCWESRFGVEGVFSRSKSQV